MKNRLEMLEQLQELDTRIDLLKSNQAVLHGEINAMDEALEAVRAEIAVLDERIAQQEQEKGGLDAALTAEQENIRRSEANMKEIKTNKEFQAVGREIAAARKQAAELEEQILQKLGLIEELKGALGTKSASLDELEQNTASRRDEKQAEISAVQQDIDSDMEQRAAITGQLPASLIKRYDSLREQRRGQAVAIARDGYCLGCNMNLPPQLYNSLFRGDDLVSCPHCQRVLILKAAQ